MHSVQVCPGHQLMYVTCYTLLFDNSSFDVNSCYQQLRITCSIQFPSFPRYCLTTSYNFRQFSGPACLSRKLQIVSLLCLIMFDALFSLVLFLLIFECWFQDSPRLLLNMMIHDAYFIYFFITYTYSTGIVAYNCCI